jgi:hypothetical protein
MKEIVKWIVNLFKETKYGDGEAKNRLESEIKNWYPESEKDYFQFDGFLNSNTHDSQIVIPAEIMGSSPYTGEASKQDAEFKDYISQTITIRDIRLGTTIEPHTKEELDEIFGR